MLTRSLRIIPKVKELPWNEQGYQHFILALRVRRSEPFFKDVAPLMDSTIADIANVFAQKAALSAVTPPAASRYSSYNASQSGVKPAVAVLDFCLTIGGPSCMAIAVDRMIHPSLLTKTYVKQSLVELLPQLRTLAMTHHLALHTEPFAFAFRAILRAWAERVLGPRPSDVEFQSAMSAMSRWRCTCAPCAELRTFLSAKADRTCHLKRIGAPKRRHVESEITMSVGRYVSFQTIGGSPQGLQVRLFTTFRRRTSSDMRHGQVTKNDSIYKPGLWKVEHSAGVRTHTGIVGDDAEQQKVFGDAFLQALRQGLPLPACPVPTASASVAASGGATTPSTETANFQGTSAAQALAAPSAVPLRQNDAHHEPYVKPAASQAVGTAVPVTPAKRKHHQSGEYELIDLCTP